MKLFMLALLLIMVSACSQGPSQTSISKMYGCENDYYGRRTCNVVFADGTPGLLIQDFYQNASYSCRKGGL